MYDDLIDPVDDTEDCTDPDTTPTAWYAGDGDIPTERELRSNPATRCPECEGMGDVRVFSMSDRTLAPYDTCPACGGSGIDV